MDKRAGTKLRESNREKMTIIEHDADVFIENPDGTAGKLLHRPKRKIDQRKYRCILGECDSVCPKNNVESRNNIR